MKNYKLILIWVWVLVATTIIALVIIRNVSWKGDSDLIIGMVAPEGVAVLNVSKHRKMVNFVKLTNGVELWIPGGLGWNESQNTLKAISISKNKVDLKKLFVFNLGVWPDKVVVIDKLEGWKNEWWLLKNLGVIGYVKWKVIANGLITKNEQIEVDDWHDGVLADELAPRDLADSEIIESEVRLTVINNTEQKGAGAFVAKVLERMGFTVIAVDNGEEIKDQCLIKVGDNLSKTLEIKKLTRLWNNCVIEKDVDLDDWTAEIYIGSKELEMIKYSNYVRTQ